MTVRIGDAGGLEASGYLGAANQTFGVDKVQSLLYTAHWGINGTATSAVVFFQGCVTLDLMDEATNKWVQSHILGRSDTAGVFHGAGSKSLSAPLNQLRISMVNGTDEFDAGLINASWRF